MGPIFNPVSNQNLSNDFYKSVLMVFTYCILIIVTFDLEYPEYVCIWQVILHMFCPFGILGAHVAVDNRNRYGFYAQ